MHAFNRGAEYFFLEAYYEIMSYKIVEAWYRNKVLFPHICKQDSDSQVSQRF